MAAARALGAEATVITFRRHPKRLLLGRAPKTLTTLEHRLELFAGWASSTRWRLRFRRVPAEPVGPSLRGADRRGRARGAALRPGLRQQVRPRPGGHPRPPAGPGLRGRGGARGHGAGPCGVQHRHPRGGGPGGPGGGRAHAGRSGDRPGPGGPREPAGARIGFPTANLDLHHELHPPPGVYAVRVERVPQGGRQPAATPGSATSASGRRWAAGRTAPWSRSTCSTSRGTCTASAWRWPSWRRLRAEQRFANLGELSAQIARDAARAREVLGG